MNGQKSRRQLLRTVASSSAIVTLGASEVAAKLSVRLVEAGVKYEVPERSDYDGIHIDSRPPYTVDHDNNNLVISESSDVLQEDQSALIDESEAKEMSSVEIGGSGKQVKAIPVSLSSRLRVMNAISLTSKHQLPTVTLHWNGESVTANIQSKGEIELSPGATKQVSLEEENVEARTIRVTDEIAEIEGIPERALGPKREFGSVDVNVTPVIKMVDYGELTVDRQILPTTPDQYR